MVCNTKTPTVCEDCGKTFLSKNAHICPECHKERVRRYAKERNLNKLGNEALKRQVRKGGDNLDQVLDQVLDPVEPTYPCTKCVQRSCSDCKDCVRWVKWFSYEWQKIRTAAGEKRQEGTT